MALQPIAGAIANLLVAETQDWAARCVGSAAVLCCAPRFEACPCLGLAWLVGLLLGYARLLLGSEPAPSRATGFAMAEEAGASMEALTLEDQAPGTSGQGDAKPIVILVIGAAPCGRAACWPPAPSLTGSTILNAAGMAGSGKTTLLQRINAHLHTHGLPGYIINLDPAVTSLPYGANIDIRDTVNYKNVMKQYGLGPNGGILTALNLFATRFDQVGTPVGEHGTERLPAPHVFAAALASDLGIWACTHP